MESHSSIEFGILFVLICLSAVFSMSETALISVSKPRLKNMVENGVRGAATVAKLLQDPERMLGTILIGIVFADFMAVSIATTIAIRYFGDGAWAIALSTVAFTVINLIFAGVTPKNFAVNHPEAVSLKLAWFIAFLSWLFTPLLYFFNTASGIILRLLGTKPNENRDEITEQDLKAIINISHEQGMLKSDEKSIFENLFATREGSAREIMTPRTDIIAISIDEDYAHIKQLFDEEKLSRLPVYIDNIDNIVGVLYLRDFIFADHTGHGPVIADIMRKPYFTFEAKPIDELFRYMRSKRISMTVVLDEFGGTAGIITLEDIIEKMIGHVGDEYESEENDIQSVTESEFIVDGSTKIEVVNEMLDVELESAEFESIGGYVIGLLGKIPQEGDIALADGLKFSVETMERNRIIELRIRLEPKPAEETEEA